MFILSGVLWKLIPPEIPNDELPATPHLPVTLPNVIKPGILPPPGVLYGVLRYTAPLPDWLTMPSGLNVPNPECLSSTSAMVFHPVGLTAEV